MPKFSPNANGFLNNAYHQNDSYSSTHITPQTPTPQTSTPQTTIHSTITINRPSFTQPLFHIYAEYDKPKIPLKIKIKNKLRDKLACNSKCLQSKLLSFFPFIQILRNYKISHFLNDLISGLTVGIINIPQGMAYGMLANLPPVYGLYTSFFPVIVYFFFGTSKHISIGTFALISLMVGVVVDKAECEMDINNSTNTTWTEPTIAEDPVVQCKLEYAVATTFLAGLFQIIFAIFKADILTEYLSGPITRALTTGAAFHIFTSQIRHVFGFSLGRYNGFFKLIKKYIKFFTSLQRTNIASMVTGLICMVLIYLNKRFVNPRIKKYIKMPFPLEFIMLIVMTGLSYHFEFSRPDVFNMTVVGDIPRGFPVPSVPNFSLLNQVIPDALVIAIIAFIISFSMAKLYAEMDKYKIDSNQELLAYGITAVASSFFSCFMPSASLSRSNVQYYSGCKTQITGLISCLLLLLVILAVGPLFYSLPNSVLAAIIIVNLHSTFMQFTDLSYLFRISVIDALTWLITCTMVVISDIDIGLGIGVAFSLYSVVLRTQRAKLKTLGNVGGTELYEDTNHFNKSKELGRIKIVRLTGSLYYANRSYFCDKLEYANVLSPEDQEKVSIRNLRPIVVECEVPDDTESGLTDSALTTTDIIIDCSLISFIDSDGIVAIDKTINDYKVIGINVHLASCNEKVSRCVQRAQQLDKMQAAEIYVTVHDAVKSIEGILVTKF